MKNLLVATTLTAALWLAAPARADSFFFSTGDPDGLLGALSQPATANNLETETADDFTLTETTSIAQATVVGLIVPSGTSLANLGNVEVEVYHVFPKDSVDPPSGRVPTRANSPADVEIDSATRDGSAGTLDFSVTPLRPSVVVANSVVNGINPKPNNLTLGDGPTSGDVVQITMTFDPPILLPADSYFFRPEVSVLGGDFLYLSAPKPIVPPGTPLAVDRQSWIRNSDLNPDWLRIGADIIGPPSAFNQAFSLAGETIPGAGTPGQANCRGKSINALTHQFRGLHRAASALGFADPRALQAALAVFCEQ